MVPIYATTSWLCLIWEPSVYQWPMLISPFREFYEAVTLMSFIQLLAVYLGGPLRMAQQLRNYEVFHVWPARYIFRRMAPGPDFVEWSLRCILQYSAVMLIVL